MTNRDIPTKKILDEASNFLVIFFYKDPPLKKIRKLYLHVSAKYGHDKSQDPIKLKSNKKNPPTDYLFTNGPIIKYKKFHSFLKMIHTS